MRTSQLAKQLAVKISAIFIVIFALGVWAAPSNTPNSPATKISPDIKATVALVQYPIQGELSYEKFMKKVEKYVVEAKNKKAVLVAFPELFIADMVEAAEKKSPLTLQFQELAKNTTPQFLADMKALAKKHQIHILSGSTPRWVDKKIYNTAQLAFPDGHDVLQDKLFLTPDEKDWGWVGASQLQVFNTPWGSTSILICYDSEFPVVSQALAKENPEVILVPSMTDTIEGFRRVRWSAQARAIEHKSYILHLGTVGKPDPSWPHYGQASFLTPSEKGFPGLLKEGTVNKDQIVVSELNLTQLRLSRAKEKSIYPVRDQKLRMGEETIRVLAQ